MRSRAGVATALSVHGMFLKRLHPRASTRLANAENGTSWITADFGAVLSHVARGDAHEHENAADGFGISGMGAIGIYKRDYR